MFISVARHNREKQELVSASNRLTDAILKSSPQGLFVLDAKDRILPPVSQSLATLFRRTDFANLTFEKLLAPIVSAKVLTVARNHIAALLAGTSVDPKRTNPLLDIDVRLNNPDGSHETAHYSFDFEPVNVPGEARTWLIRVTDITTRVQATRELEDLRAQFQTQGEILSGVMQMGRSRFGAFLTRIDGSMKNIATVLKKPAREEEAFRHKLDEILDEVDRIRREGAALRLSALEGSARVFEDALHDLRNRSALSGSDFLPLTVKMDHLYEQFALIKSLSLAAGSVGESVTEAPLPRVTSSGTLIIEAPKFAPEPPPPASDLGAQETAPAGSLDNTLLALTDHVAQEQNKVVRLKTRGLQLVPPKFQSAIKNIAIQLIRNSVMHGIEPAAEREAAGKPSRGTLRLEFRVREKSVELLFEDDGRGLVPEEVRATAVARGVLSEEAAKRLRDREAIKLIFKSRYTTMNSSSDTKRGMGMSLVRRYVSEAGGKIALASLPGFETRFKISLPLSEDGTQAGHATPDDDAESLDPATADIHGATSVNAAEDARAEAEAQDAAEARAAAEAQAAAEARAAAEAKAAAEAQAAAEAKAEAEARAAAEAQAAAAARAAAEARAAAAAQAAAEAQAAADAHAAAVAQATAEAEAAAQAAAVARAAAEAHAAALAEAAALAQAAADAHAMAVAHADAILQNGPKSAPRSADNCAVAGVETALPVGDEKVA